MVRKRHTPAKGNGTKLRGRPPMRPKTALAKWIQTKGLSVTDFATTLAGIAAGLAQARPELGIRASDAPVPKTLLDAVNARHWPKATLVLLTRLATGGDVC